MRRGTLAVLASAVLFGTTGTARALGPKGTDPLVVGALRLIIGGALLTWWALRQVDGAANWKRVVSSPLGVLCGVGVAGYNACFFFGVDRAGVAVGTMITIGSAPVMTGLLGWLVDGTMPTPRWFTATALSLAGLTLLVLFGTGARPVAEHGKSVVIGAGFALLAAAGYAVYTVLGKRVIGLWGADAFIGGAFALGAALLSPVVLVALASGHLGWLTSGRGIAMVAWLGIAPTALAYVLFGRGLQVLAPASVSTLTLAEPVVAAVLGVVVLDEHLTLAGVFGALLVIAGLALLALAPNRGDVPATVTLQP